MCENFSGNLRTGTRAVCAMRVNWGGGGGGRSHNVTLPAIYVAQPFRVLALFALLPSTPNTINIMRAMIIGHVIVNTPPEMKQWPHWRCLSTVASEAAVKTLSSGYIDVLRNN